MTFNTFKLEGYIQKEFFDSEETTEEYSCWKDVREFCYSVIRGKRTPLSFRFIFSLSRKNIERLIAKAGLSLSPDTVQGLYLNLRYDDGQLTCVTGTSFTTFVPDKSLEHAWDEMVRKFFLRQKIDFEQ